MSGVGILSCNKQHHDPSWPFLQSSPATFATENLNASDLIVVGNINSPLLTMNTSCRRKVNEKTLDLRSI